MIARPLEIYLLKFFKGLGAKKCLLAVSGGADSMALLAACAGLRKKTRVEFVVAHIHHGSEVNRDYRDQAQKFVDDVCRELGIDFVTNVSGSASSSSEVDLRRFRLQQLKVLKEKTQSDFVVFAHHAEDLLETRLIRLIRGTGPEGLVAMQEQKGAVLRPLLGFQKEALMDYLAVTQMRHLEDPSNHSVKYLRNWIRREWLPALETQRPGSTRRLAQSLISVVENSDRGESLSNCYENSKIIRPHFIILSPSDKRRVLGAYLQQRGFKDYGLSHINELIKRLDVEQKDLTFRLLKKIWLANAKHIWCE